MGKILILFMAEISVKGILLVIIPLLSLTANQLSRIKKAAQGYGIITAHHLDDTSSMDLEKKIILRMDTFSYHSSSPMLLLCSPQYLAEKASFRDAVIRCKERQVLRLVSIDEAHL